MTQIDEPIVNSEWGTINYLKITKYNRTVSVIKGMASLQRDLPDDVMVSITYSLFFPRMILFSRLIVLFHARNFTNILDVRPLNNRTDQHFSGTQKTNEC